MATLNQRIEQIKIYLESVDDRPEKAKVAVILWSLHCCIRCVWRLLHVRDITFYRQNSQFLRDALDYLIEKYAASDWQTKYKEVPPRESQVICPLCFGLLQKVELDEFQEPLFTKFLNCGYEDQEYSLSITVPPSTFIRHYGVYYYLVKQFGEVSYWTEVESRKDDEGVPEIKEVMKWILGYQIFKKIHKKFQFQSPFEVRLNFTHKETSEEYVVMTMSQDTQHSEKRRKNDSAMEDSSATVLKRLRTLNMAEFLNLVNVPPKPVSTFCECEQTFFRASVYVAGRYFKFSREMSQTPWVMNSGERRTETSVTDAIVSVLKTWFQADDCRFSSAGREDVDVRMLGTGRPFAVELINPRRHTFSTEQYREMQQQINTNSKSVAVVDLQPVSKKDVSLLQQGEDTKIKRYQCIIWLSKDATPDEVKFLSTLKDLVIEQKTPIRVLHRRSAATRKKIIYTLNGEWLDSRHILLDLVTQAGTYVKEFVHGDFGRTHPNVGSLLNCEADLLLLDCVGIDFDFPPKLSNSTRNFEREYNIANIVDEWRALSTQSTPFSCK